MNTTRFHPDWIPEPGATVDDIIRRFRDAADRMEQLVRYLGDDGYSELVSGRREITKELAVVLAQTTGVDDDFWLERERLFRVALEERAKEKSFLEIVPLRNMLDRGFVREFHCHNEAMDGLLQFFGYSSIDECAVGVERGLAKLKQKTSLKLTSDPMALAVWVRAGELVAESIECDPWDRNRLIALIPRFRELTRTHDPRKYMAVLVELCASCGIALVSMQLVPGCRARAAIKWLSTDKALLLVSFRHLSDDQFWFTFFHEVAHLVLHGRHDTIDDEWSETDELDVQEQQADDYASTVLLPSVSRAVLQNLDSDRKIIEFARSRGIARGIVVGQMQHRRVVGYDKYNHLKVYYDWVAGLSVPVRVK